MPQHSRSHLVVLFCSFVLLAGISSAEILAANPTTSRHRQPRQTRVGSARPTDPHIDGECHAEAVASRHAFEEVVKRAGDNPPAVIDDAPPAIQFPRVAVELFVETPIRPFGERYSLSGRSPPAR